MHSTLSPRAVYRTLDNDGTNGEMEDTCVLSAPRESPKETDTSRRPSKAPSYLIAALIAFGSLGLGFTLGFTAPAAQQLLRSHDAGNSTKDHDGRLQFNSNEISWFGSILFLAGLVGGGLAGPLAEWLGRKPTMMACNLPALAGWLLVSFAKNFGTVLTGRFILGFSLGAGILLNPVYLAEAVLPELRGALTTVLQMSLTLGIVVSFALGLFMTYEGMALVGASLAFFYSALLFAVPETPRWYLRHKKLPKGEAAMRRLRGRHADFQSELADIYAAVAVEENTPPFSFSELRQSQIYRPFAMSIALMLFQQLSGVNAVLSYTTIIFDRVGLQSKDSLITLGVSVVQLCFTFISIFFVDRYGRRPLLMVAGAGAGLACVAMTVFFFLTDRIHGALAVALPIAAIYVYIAAFSMGLGIIPWLFMPEAFPSRALSKLSSISASVNWLMAFLVTRYFANLTAAIGDGGTFAILATVCFLLVIFSKVWLVETKGRSVEEMEAYFQRRQESDNLSDSGSLEVEGSTRGESADYFQADF